MNNSMQYANWYLSLQGKGFAMSQSDCMMHFQIMMTLMQYYNDLDTKRADKYSAIIEKMVATYEAKGGRMPDYDNN